VAGPQGQFHLIPVPAHRPAQALFSLPDPLLDRVLVQHELLGRCLVAPPGSQEAIKGRAQPAWCSSSPASPALIHAIELRWSARRIDRVTMVKVGFANPLVGNTEDPVTKRLDVPCTRQLLSTTPSASSSDIRVVPMW
jgi:hypothetical protein